MSNAVWSGFFFREDATTPLISGLHCTHKYLGELDDDQVKTVHRIIELYFGWMRPKQPGYWEFNKLAFFDQGATVLLNEKIADPLSLLREELDGFRKDDYPAYRPHVTIANPMRAPKAPIAVPLHVWPVEYRLMRGPDKLRVWKLEEL